MIAHLAFHLGAIRQIIDVIQHQKSDHRRLLTAEAMLPGQQWRGGPGTLRTIVLSCRRSQPQHHVSYL
jgi:hypothetical protein